MDGNRWVVGGIIIFTLVVVGGITWAYGRTTQTEATANVPQYQVGDERRPAVVADNELIDLGTIKLSDVKEVTFQLTNQGTEPLYLTNVVTSCGCTSAEITVNGEQSPILSMHDNPAWTGIVAPGEQAIVEVIYTPRIHPVEGEVTRYVQLNTNDPDQPQLQLSVRALVEK